MRVNLIKDIHLEKVDTLKMNMENFPLHRIFPSRFKK